MKRYVVEMANDFEKRCPEKSERIVKIRNLYLSGLVTEVEAIKGLVETIEEGVER